MHNRVCIIVLDSVGIGAMPDADQFGDAGAHTLGNIYRKRGYLSLPNLYALGLGNIEDARLPCVDKPIAAYGRMAEVTKAKDTTSGHWELAGLVMDPPFRTFHQGFPEEWLQKWLEAAGYKAEWLGNMAISGTAIIDRYGAAHMQTGAPIVYTSADSVFQVAAHEKIIPLEALYRLCQCAREQLTGPYNVGRVIARPFIGEPGGFTRTENRRDYAVPPPEDTILDCIVKSGQTVLGIGKIEDIFYKRGITHVNHTTNNHDGIQATIDALRHSGDALIFTNLVDFDMLYGHRNNVEGYAQALEYFDAKLPDIINAMKPGDLLFITADHGCDPTTDSTDHSREYVPVIVYGKPAGSIGLAGSEGLAGLISAVKSVNLGTRLSYADLGATVYEALGHGSWRCATNRPYGNSFLSLIL